MTFEQIYDDLAQYASNVMKNFGILPYELPVVTPVDWTQG